MNEEEKQEIKELINLLYNNHLSQYGKRKLETYIKKLQKELDKKDKVIDKMAKTIAGLPLYDFGRKEYFTLEDEGEVIVYFYKKVEEENENR